MRDLDAILKRKSGIKLDLGCGYSKHDGWVGMDKREIANVEIVHDIEVVPWPLPSDCATTILCSHILEHIDPRNFLAVMAEIYRVGKHDCQVQISTPYAGSYGSYQDPTHTRPGFNESTWNYFDPRPGPPGSDNLWLIYRPPPMLVERCHWDLTGNMEVLLRILKDEELLRRILEPQGIDLKVIP